MYQNTFLNSIVTLSCGGSTSNNNSYIVQSSTTTLTSPCTYTVCPCSTDICRIRYDFTTNTLSAPVLQTASNPGTGLEESHAIGDCTTDQLSITSPGKVGSPIICGTNTDQHSNLPYEMPTFQQLTSKQMQFQRHLSIVEIIVVVLEKFQKVNGNFGKQTEASFLLLI